MEEGFGMVGCAPVFDDAPQKIIDYGVSWSRVTGRIPAVNRTQADACRQPKHSLKSMPSTVPAFSSAAALSKRPAMAEDYFLCLEDLDLGARSWPS
jgi:N-acetylglucosaminyl-diphospho-decaprenol L-rhamnosyltransferase